jgi:hypothetical protein
VQTLRVSLQPAVKLPFPKDRLGSALTVRPAFSNDFPIVAPDDGFREGYAAHAGHSYTVQMSTRSASWSVGKLASASNSGNNLCKLLTAHVPSVDLLLKIDNTGNSHVLFHERETHLS